MQFPVFMMRSLFSCMTDHNTHHMTKANFHTSHIHGNAKWHPTNPLSTNRQYTMARLSGRQITRSAGGYTENLSWQALWHHNRLPQCGLLWNCGDQQHGWVLTYKTMRGLESLWQWPWKVIYSVMWRLTVWQILTDVLENTNATNCGVKKIIRDHVKITGTWWQDTDIRVFGSLVSSSHLNPPVRSQSYVPAPDAD